MNTGKTGIGRFFKGFVYAFEGIVSCIKTERNMRFHIGVAVLVILLMRFYGLSAAETAAVYICIGLVISLELVNTAVEAAVDMACKDKNPLAKKAKDCAAGAVLIAAVASVAVGIRIFWDYYAFMAIASYFARNIWLGIALAAGVLNALVGEKIAAVSDKPQTTRTKITGVLTKGETQFVFIDTPGMHKAKNKLSEHMLNAVNESVAGVDLIILMADCTKKISENERELVKGFKTGKTKVILVLNKIDLLENKEDLIAVIAEYSKLFDFIDIVPVSVLEKDGLDIIMEDLEKNAVEGPHYFPDDKFTDQPEKVIMAEIIREKALNNLNDEVPHGIAVTIEQLNERENRNGEAILDVTATIYCERESHKGILIGKGGSMLRKIGQEARADLEDFFQIKVNLQCWVKVKEGWRNREGMIKNFGLE